MSQHSSIDATGLQLDASKPHCMTPSTLRAWIECPLKALFVVNRAPGGLPRHPQAILGSISHAVYERVHKASLSGEVGLDDLNIMWDEEVAREEKLIGESQISHLESPLVPLSGSCRKFERHRLNTLRLAAAILESTNHESSESSSSGHARVSKQVGSSGNLGAEIEKWVTARDGTVGGYIDAMLWRDGELIIRDYKTGPVAADDGCVKAEYIDQLRFYAALCFESESIGRWPDVLELVDSRGRATVVELDVDKAKELLDDATVALTQMHDQAASLEAGKVGSNELARPMEADCQYCAFRSKCPGYRSRLRREREISHSSGVVDVFGRVSQIEQQGQQSTLQLESGCTIGGMALGPEGDGRCSQVTCDAVGTEIEVYELRSLGRWKSMLQVTPRTVAIIVPH